jgi:hypothetical protein
MWDFFQGFNDKVAVEFGTHKGQSTRILSFLFKKVYTVNNNENISAKELNKDRDNIVYIDNFDLYSYASLPIEDEVSMFLIDAGHEYEQVIHDINRACRLFCKEDCYIVFDDYGMSQYEMHVRRAVNEAIDKNILQPVINIGHDIGHNFGGDPPRILSQSEGLISKIIWQ